MSKRKFTSDFKFKVVLEALKERSTAKELCEKYELHPNQISSWKREFLEKASDVMDSRPARQAQEDFEKEKAKLYAKIGQLQMEVEFLKKKLF